MRSEPGQIAAAFPRPGRTLKAVLATLGGVALALAIVINWVPGDGKAVPYIKDWLLFQPLDPRNLWQRPWTLVTSGLVTLTLSHILWSLLGLYFLTPTLEKRWGGARLVRFLLTSVVMGNLLVLLASLLPFQHPVFHPTAVYGPSAAIAGIAVAWSRENANRQFMFMFFLPMTGRSLFWITVGFAALYVVFGEAPPEGAFALFGGILTGILLAGAPSPLRAAYLRTKLFFLRRQGATLDIESFTSTPPQRPRTKRKAGGPPLRVVQGGADDDLAKRKPPKDKRYLN